MVAMVIVYDACSAADTGVSIAKYIAGTIHVSHSLATCIATVINNRVSSWRGCFLW